MGLIIPILQIRKVWFNEASDLCKDRPSESQPSALPTTAPGGCYALCGHVPHCYSRLLWVGVSCLRVSPVAHTQFLAIPEKSGDEHSP